MLQIEHIRHMHNMKNTNNLVGAFEWRECGATFSIQVWRRPSKTKQISGEFVMRARHSYSGWWRKENCKLRSQTPRHHQEVSRHQTNLTNAARRRKIRTCLHLRTDACKACFRGGECAGRVSRVRRFRRRRFIHAPRARFWNFGRTSAAPCVVIMFCCW